MELGSLMAQNLTTQGLIGVSASDGLTTLANDILLIQGGGGGSTTLFEDTCSTDNTSNWSSSTANAYWETVGNTYSLSFDTDHYVFSHSPGSFLAIRIPGMTASLDNYVLSADILANGTSTNYGGGLAIIKQDNTGIGMVQPNSTSGKHTYLYNNNGSGSILDQTVTSGYTVGAYHHHELTKSGTTVTYTISYNGNVLFTHTKTDIATALATETIPAVAIGRWDTANFKNIKVESLGGGSDCSQYTTQINNAIEYINGSGS